MDIKPADILRVLERYPEVLGFKLEGTMSQWLIWLELGCPRRETGGVLTGFPEILGMRLGRTIKPFVEYLEDLGIPILAVARLIEKRPHILGFGLEDRVKTNVKSLLEFNVTGLLLASVIAQYLEIIGIEVHSKLRIQWDFLNSIVDLSPEDFGRVVEKIPQRVSLSHRPIVKHVDFLRECGFSSEQVRKMVVGCPRLLALNLDIMKLSFDYIQGTMARPLDDLVFFPACFTYGVETIIKPRHKMIAIKVGNAPIAWLLNCTAEKFEERTAYDAIGMEQIEVDSSFDMSTLMDPRMMNQLLITRMTVMIDIPQTIIPSRMPY